MTPKEIANHRLYNQQIAMTSSRTPEEVVAKLGAMQAQDYAGALWAVGLRLPPLKEGEVENALARRTIVHTWPMRGTLHFVAAADQERSPLFHRRRRAISTLLGIDQLGTILALIRQCQKK